MRKVLVFICCIIAVVAQAQPLLNTTNDIPPAKQHQLLLQKAKYVETSQRKTTKTTASVVFDTARWNHLVDSTWGNGIADTAKLSMFDRIWNPIDSNYPCFVQLPLYNWDSIINAMRNQISAGVSRGRMAAILSELRRYINDGHTNMYDVTVSYPSSIYQGLPLMRGESGRFGACLTMLSDSTAMVYNTVSGHPFNLAPGDIILGYNNILWKDLVKIILQYQLPNSVYIGSTDAATYHRMIKAAGENWYLFDTINIKKCNGTIVSFPTVYMKSTNYSGILCTEQMPIAGIHKLTYNEFYNQNKSVSSGMMPGTKIGYVYMLDCSDPTYGEELYNAVKALVEDSMAQALIIDIRTNYGGGFMAYWKTFTYLMHGDVTWVGYGERTTYSNKYLMFNQPSSWYDIEDDDPHSYNKPIALLCGPEAVSAGDFFQIMYKRHPWVKTFGKSTAGAYGSLISLTTGQANYYANMQRVNFYEVTNPSYYISHTEYPIDMPVWFTRDSVCAGKDNIVSEAVNWINAKTTVPVFEKNKLDITTFPNPVRTDLNLAIVADRDEHITIEVMNIYGVNVLQQNHVLTKGSNNLKIDLSSLALPNGNYLISIEGKDIGRQVKKVDYIR
jgi:hypothetical protein